MDPVPLSRLYGDSLVDSGVVADQAVAVAVDKKDEQSVVRQLVVGMLDYFEVLVVVVKKEYVSAAVAVVYILAMLVVLVQVRKQYLFVRIEVAADVGQKYEPFVVEWYVPAAGLD